MKLYVASTTGDSKTFNRIYGYLYDPLATNANRQKRAVEVVKYEPDRNNIVIIFRDENDGMDVTTWTKIKAFLEGKGSATMADDANITIIPPTKINKTE